MSKPWDGLKVGDDQLSDVYFGTGYESDFTKPLDGGANAGGIIGTTKGYSGDPFNFTYPTDGQFKLGGHLQCHQTYATGYAYPNASDQRNKETQHYVHPHGDNPDPLALFEVRDGKLVMKARPVLEAERAWATVKGYAQNKQGNEANLTFLNGEGIDYSSWGISNPDQTEGALAHFRNMPADFLCPMISKYNRQSMSFGYTGCRVMVPVGARATGSTDDLRNIDTWFPAFWDLEDVPARCDINGRWHTKDTFTPANVGAGDNLNELDIGEFFGYSNTQVHITSHTYVEGQQGYIIDIIDADGNKTQARRIPQTQTNHTGTNRADQSTPSYPSIAALRGQFVELGIHRFPPGGTDFPNGVIMYLVNGKIVAQFHMPEYMGKPKYIYEPVATRTYYPFLEKDFSVRKLGVQAYEDGSPAYMHFCPILNIATNAGFTRSQAKSYVDSGHAPVFAENEEMIVEWMVMKPLIDENPDAYPFIDYTEGEFGGSGDNPYTEEEPDYDPDNPDTPVIDYGPDIQLPVESPDGDSSEPTPKSDPTLGFVEHDWFTLMRGVDPTILIKDKPYFVFSNGVRKTAPRDTQKKTVADEGDTE